MAIVEFIGIVEKAGPGFSVFFPDVPGCCSAGRTEVELIANAHEGLAAHLAELARGGDPLPQRTFNHRPDPEVEEYCRILVRVELPGKAIRLNITMDEGLVAAIDRVASNRSSFLADAARSALAKRQVERTS